MHGCEYQPHEIHENYNPLQINTHTVMMTVLLEYINFSLIRVNHLYKIMVLVHATTTSKITLYVALVNAL